MVDRQEPRGQRQLGPVEHGARGQPDLALAAVALVDRPALELGIAPVPAARAGPALAPAQREQRRPALRLGPEPLPELGLAQALDPPPQPTLRTHPLTPQHPKPARMLARCRMGVTDNQVVLCGTSILHWYREDGAPHFAGLPPATTPAQREEYAAISREHERTVNQPVARRLNRLLEDLDIGPLSMTLFDSVVALADAYLQLTVPSFEFPRSDPSIGAVHRRPSDPSKSSSAPVLGARAGRLAQGCPGHPGNGANHDFGLLIAPTLAALANEPDLLVVVTAGGRSIDDIPGPIPGNARLASYLPFEWVLPKVDVLVTNGGYGSVNQALSFGIPLVTAGLTEDKADVNVRVAWSGVGINLATNEPTPQALREAIRTVLDKPKYRWRASSMANEFARIDTRSEILRIVRPSLTGLRMKMVCDKSKLRKWFQRGLRRGSSVFACQTQVGVVAGQHDDHPVLRLPVPERSRSLDDLSLLARLRHSTGRKRRRAIFILFFLRKRFFASP